VVYPEGAWYREVDETAVDRIVEEHLIGGRMVEDILFAADPLVATKR
jgi:(2Fe-2S) ferredoxin